MNDISQKMARYIEDRRAILDNMRELRDQQSQLEDEVALVLIEQQMTEFIKIDWDKLNKVFSRYR